MTLMAKGASPLSSVHCFTQLSLPVSMSLVRWVYLGWPTPCYVVLGERESLRSANLHGFTLEKRSYVTSGCVCCVVCVGALLWLGLNQAQLVLPLCDLFPVRCCTASHLTRVAILSCLWGI